MDEKIAYVKTNGSSHMRRKEVQAGTALARLRTLRHDGTGYADGLKLSLRSFFGGGKYRQIGRGRTLVRVNAVQISNRFDG